ncbi:MAG: cupin domain-containing protein [Deltaproteobacteria bacterium]|jgi:mannose-6-phosphate isomerase-like protein (cupin superfamily)|nr:cupin domain-containing protein [Deltaproteobacteria bacterium]
MIFKDKDAVKATIDKAKGGVGQIFSNTFLNDANRPERTRAGMVAVNTLPPGASLGFHVHETNEEIYYFIQGQGLYTDADRRQYPIAAGDLTLTRQGEGHALDNAGAEPLVFAAVIIDEGRP